MTSRRWPHQRTAPRCHWLRLGLAWFVLGYVFCAPLRASQPVATERVLFSISAQPLPNALKRYAEQAKLQILFQPSQLPKDRMVVLEGYFTLPQAMEQLLRDTQLTATFGGHKAVVIEPVTPSLPVMPEDSLPTVLAPRSQPNGQMEEVLVSGIRQSLLRSLTAKRHASAVVDFVTSEDIGKFPDKNVADSLQRIPGISVDRIWGEGRDINIRGTEKDVNRTLMNGQNVASAYWWANDNLGRGFNYSILASELVASLEVYKSPEADRDEGSIGGTVNIRTRRPLDIGEPRWQLSLQEQYSQLPDAWDPQASALLNWVNHDNTFGILASLNWQNRSVRRDGLEAFPDTTLYDIRLANGDTVNDVYVPWGVGSAIFQQQRRRATGNITLQWQPNNAWDITLNGVLSDMSMDNTNHNFLATIGGLKLQPYPDTLITNPHFVAQPDGTRTLIAAELGNNANNQNTTGAAIDAMYRDAYIDTQVIDLDMTYRGSGWNTHIQLGTTWANGGSDHAWMYRFEGDSRLRYDLRNGDVDVTFLDLDPTQAASLNRFSAESRDWIRTMEDREHYAQFDLQWGLNHHIWHSLKAGIKWRDHTVENHRTEGRIDTTHKLWPELQAIGLEHVSNGLSPRLHNEAGNDDVLQQYAWPSRSLLEQVINPYFEQGVLQYEVDTSAFYNINEVIQAGYLKASGTWHDWSFNAGMRAVHTRQRSQAFQEGQPVTHLRRYSDVLPSMNALHQWHPDWLLRLSAAQVMARPTFPDLSSNFIIDATNGTASAGSPELEPFRADQFDIGIEWYYQPESIIAATVFYKDVSTFIFNRTQTEQVNGEAIPVTRPDNAPGLDIQGVEVQWQQPLWGNVGAMANYTYTDAEIASHPGTDSLNLPGNSKDQLNASLYYENERIAARLSYNYRSQSFGGFASGSQDVTEAYDQWDMAASWWLTEDLSVFVEGVNLLNEVVYYRTASGIPKGYYENGRRFVLGVRAKW